MIEGYIYRLSELYYEQNIGDSYTWFEIENAKNVFRYTNFSYLNEKTNKMIYESWQKSLEKELEKCEKILRKS